MDINEVKRLRELEKENAELELKLAQPQAIIEVQKNWRGRWPRSKPPRTRGRTRESPSPPPRGPYFGCLRCTAPPLVELLSQGHAQGCHRASPRKKPPSALSAAERQGVLDVIDSPRFMNVSPYQVYATLLDEGAYLCSVSTMYRILREHN